MTGWPIVNRQPVRLPTLPGYDDLHWVTLIELTKLRPGEWALIRPKGWRTDINAMV